MNIDRFLRELGVDGKWEECPQSFRLQSNELDLKKMAQCMAAEKARFITITASPASQAEYWMEYHWDLDGQMLTFQTCTREKNIESIASLCPAADWVEREIHDYFAVGFSGRKDVPRLVLREGDEAGVFSKKGEAKK